MPITIGAAAKKQFLHVNGIQTCIPRQCESEQVWGGLGSPCHLHRHVAAIGFWPLQLLCRFCYWFFKNAQNVIKFSNASMHCDLCFCSIINLSFKTITKSNLFTCNMTLGIANANNDRGVCWEAIPACEWRQSCITKQWWSSTIHIQGLLFQRSQKEGVPHLGRKCSESIIWKRELDTFWAVDIIQDMGVDLAGCI